jgi:hypothetical protein
MMAQDKSSTIGQKPSAQNIHFGSLALPSGGRPNSHVTKGHLAIWPKLLRIGLAKMPNLPK